LERHIFKFLFVAAYVLIYRSFSLELFAFWSCLRLWAVRSQALQVERLKMRIVRRNRFPFKKCTVGFKLPICVETNYLNKDMYKFESSQKDEIRALSDDSLKVYSKSRIFYS